MALTVFQKVNIWLPRCESNTICRVNLRLLDWKAGALPSEFACPFLVCVWLICLGVFVEKNLVCVYLTCLVMFVWCVLFEIRQQQRKGDYNQKFGRFCWRYLNHHHHQQPMIAGTYKWKWDLQIVMVLCTTSSDWKTQWKIIGVLHKSS